MFSMRKDTLSVGRGGSSVWVDVQVVTTSKVSREHFRLRRDGSGAFFIQDLSSWGTSVSTATLIPPAVNGPDGVLQPGAEQPLPSPARIELADALVIHFEAQSGAHRREVQRDLVLLAALRVSGRACRVRGGADLALARVHDRE